MASKREKLTPEEIRQAIRYLEQDIAVLDRDQRDAVREFEAQRVDLFRQIKELRELLDGDGR